jgi:hypothetical protein
MKATKADLTTTMEMVYVIHFLNFIQALRTRSGFV